MEPNNTDAAAPASPDTSAQAETTYSKADLTRIVQREVAKASAESNALRERFTALEEEKRIAEEAKLSASERLTKEHQRATAALEAKIADLTKIAASERSRRHDAIVAQAAATILSKRSAQLMNPAATPLVERLVRERLKVESSADGAEHVAVLFGPGDSEPLSSAEGKLADELIAPFLKAQGGTGGNHNGSASARSNALSITDPAARIAAGLQRR